MKTELALRQLWLLFSLICEVLANLYYVLSASVQLNTCNPIVLFGYFNARRCTRVLQSFTRLAFDLIAKSRIGLICHLDFGKT